MDSAVETRKTEEGGGGESPLITGSINKYKEMISTLPKRDCWGTTLHQYQGFWYHSDNILGMMLAQQNFKPQPCDIIVSSFPKSGTTWLKALAFTIVTRSDFSNSSPLLTATPHVKPSLMCGNGRSYRPDNG